MTDHEILEAALGEALMLIAEDYLCQPLDYTQKNRLFNAVWQEVGKLTPIQFALGMEEAENGVVFSVEPLSSLRRALREQVSSNEIIDGLAKMRAAFDAGNTGLIGRLKS